MAYKVNSLEEMPNALSYLIESVEVLQTKVNALQHKQASNSPKWMDIDELCAYLPSHPAQANGLWMGINQTDSRT